MKNLIQMMVIILVAQSATNNGSFAQDISGTGIQSQGEIVLERKPELLRMTVDLRASGEKMADAVAKMNERCGKAEKQLSSMGAAKDSWKFGEIHLDQRQMNRRKQLQAMISQRVAVNAGGAAKEKDTDKPVPVDLTLTLTAEWPLKGADSMEILAAAHKLQEAIREADIGGAEDVDELSEEEAELTEEMEGMEGIHFAGGGRGRLNRIVSYTTSQFGDSNEQKPGEPSFVFVAKISAADLQKAMNDAFLAAKAEATQLAQAARIELGTLRNLSSTRGAEPENQSDDQANYYPQVFNSVMQRQMGGRNSANEAIGPFPGLLKYKVTVNATFAFK